MNGMKKFFPCIWVRPQGEKVLATAGMALECLYAAEVLEKEVVGVTAAGQTSPERGKSAHLIPTLWENTIDLIKNLIGWGPQTFVELHWTSWPNLETPTRGRVDITLTLNSFSDNDLKAKEEVLTHFMPFKALLLSHLRGAVFSEIDDEDVLKTRLGPFKPYHCNAIVRQTRRIPLSMPLTIYSSPVGFLREEDIGVQEDEGKVIFLLSPWIPSLNPLHHLLDFLLWYPEPVKLLVRLRLFPCDLPEEPLLETIKECETILLESLKPGEAILSNQVSAIKDFALCRLAELAQGKVRVSAYVATRSAPDNAMVSGLINGFLSFTALETGTIPQGGAAIQSISPEEMNDPDVFPDCQSFTFREAACFFRLPWAAQSDLPGVPLKRWRTAFADLPEQQVANNSSVLLGMNVHRGISQQVRIRIEDRMRHIYVVGQTGTGKSTILESLILQDINEGRGLCLIDPHGEMVNGILDQYPLEREQDLVLIDLTDHDYPFALNLLAWDTEEERDRIVDELYVTLERMYDMQAVGGPIFEKHFRGMLRLLMGEEKRDFVTTLLELPLLYTDRTFRKFCMEAVKDEQIAQFIKEAEGVRGEAAIENLSVYVTSKFSRFTQDRRLRRIFGQQNLSLNFREAMDEGKVVLINLGKGIFGESVSALVAGQLVGRFKTAAMMRATIPEQQRRDFFLYVDEFQNLAHENFADLLSEARKYRLGLVLANQYTQQLQKEWIGRKDSMLSSILGNVGIIIAFRCGVEDANVLEGVFSPVFSAHDLRELPNWEAYLKLHSIGGSFRPFNVKTIKRPVPRNEERIDHLRQLSYDRYCLTATDVDKQIKERWDSIRERVSRGEK